MTLSARQRRALAAAAHGIRPLVTLSAARLTESVLSHIRRAFARRELLKARIRTDRHEVCEQVAAELAARVPCEIVQRVGRVVVLYRPLAEPEAPGTPGQPAREIKAS